MKQDTTWKKVRESGRMTTRSRKAHVKEQAIKESVFSKSQVGLGRGKGVPFSQRGMYGYIDNIMDL
jgi:hypothetical protein